MSVLYDWCCSYSGPAPEVGDIFGKPWYAWEKYFTITAVYHLDVGDPYDIFFTADIEPGKSISTSDAYMKDYGGSPPTYTLITYSSDIRIAGVVTEDGTGLPSVSLLGVSTDGDGKYLAAKTSPFTGTAEPSKTNYTFTPETVTYTNLTKYAVDDYIAESLLPNKPINPTPATVATGIKLGLAFISWEAG